MPSQYSALGIAERSASVSSGRRACTFVIASSSANTSPCSADVSKHSSSVLVLFGPTRLTTRSSSAVTTGTVTSSMNPAKPGGVGSMSPPKARRQRCANPTGFLAVSCAHQFVKKMSCCINMMCTFVGSMCNPSCTGTGPCGLATRAF